MPNRQLRLLAEWYSRQLLISDKIEEAEVTRSANSDLADIMQILEKYNPPAAPAEKPAESEGVVAEIEEKKEDEEIAKEVAHT